MATKSAKLQEWRALETGLRAELRRIRNSSTDVE